MGIEAVLISISVAIGLSWAGWVSLLTIQHGRQIQGLIEKVCVHSDDIKSMKTTIERIDKNVVRIGMSLKINDELEM